MEPLARLTPATVDVLDALVRDRGGIWGLQIVSSTGRPSGSVYPILERLERAGWVESEWEDNPARPGPRRRVYTLTGEGRVAAAEAVARMRRADHGHEALA